MAEIDLFGNGPPQQSLFGDGEGRIPHLEAASYVPKPEDIRAKLQLLLNKARSADRMPWNERNTRMWETVFPQMANWIPDEDERNQLCFEFAQEIERLKRAA